MDLEELAELASAWIPTPLRCPVGRLVGARCPGPPPGDAVASSTTRELEYASKLHPPRRREWLAGRLCLRAALPADPGSPIDLLPLPSGAPCLPAGVTGSISHKGNLAVALVMAGNNLCGVDIEQIEDRDAALVNRIMTPREQAQGVSPAIATLHFSAKEAVFKLLPAETQSDVDFEDIELTQNSQQHGWTEFNAHVSGALRVRVHARVTARWILTIASRS